MSKKKSENTVVEIQENVEATENTENTTLEAAGSVIDVDHTESVDEVVEKAQAQLPSNAVILAQMKMNDRKETVEKIVKRFQTIRFDLAIQRSDVWDIYRRSKLIESLALGYPIPPVYSVQEDKKDWMLDGKQRLTTLFRFFGLIDDEGNALPKENFGNGFALKGDVATHIVITDDLGNVEGVYEFNGKTFNELHPTVQREILGASITFVRANELTDEQKDEIFVRLNNGMPLKNMELARAIAGSGTMHFVEDISNMPFFSDTMDMPASTRKRLGDEELIVQIMYLLDRTDGGNVEYLSGVKSFTAANMRDFMKEFQLTDEMKQTVVETTKYLREALPENFKKLRKVHIHGIFLNAMRAMADGVAPQKFGGWVQDFFAHRLKPKTQYAEASSSGSGKAENIRKRITLISKDYEDHIDTAPDYKMVNVPKADTDKVVSVVDVTPINDEATNTPAETTEAAGEAVEATNEAPVVEGEAAPVEGDVQAELQPQA